MEVAEVGARDGKKVTRSLLRKAKVMFIPRHIICSFCMCCDNSIFRQFVVIACFERVVRTCSGQTC